MSEKIFQNLNLPLYNQVIMEAIKRPIENKYNNEEKKKNIKKIYDDNKKEKKSIMVTLTTSILLY